MKQPATAGVAHGADKQDTPAAAPPGPAPQQAQRPVLLFGEFRLDTARRQLFRDDTALRLGGRVLDLLVLLAERPGEVLSHGELEARIWPGAVVEGSSLRVRVAALRRALGKERYIANVPGRGYSFVGTVALAR